MASAAAAHVWVVATDDVPPRVAARWLSLLDADEHDRHARLVFKQDRDAYLGAHALLRSALALHTAVEPAAWRFVRRRGEKPVAAPDLPQLSFSLSHTRGLAACAVAPDQRGREFLTRWTLKEAYLKTLGIGLDRLDSARDLQRTAFAVDGSGVLPDLDGVEAEDLRRWSFATWSTATHVVSAGVRGRTLVSRRIVAARVDGALLPGRGAFAADALGSL